MILTREVVTCRVKMGTKILCQTKNELRMNSGQLPKRAASLPEWHAAASAPCGKRRTTIWHCRRPTAAA
nr:MAG TPA: hypothetical protein [Caudoviricetes sp.]